MIVVRVPYTCAWILSILHISLEIGNCCDPDAQYGCSGESNSLSSGGSLYCDGYHSCSQISSITSNSVILCGGSYSCFEAELVQRISSTNPHTIGCYGLNSCAKIEYLYSVYW